MKPIGILDSGLGGVSVVLALQKAYPDMAMVYLADQIHAPYGSKSKEEICAIMHQNIRWFEQQGITEVLLACNTASSNALDYLHQHFPNMNIEGIIDVTVQQLDDADCVGVLATSATIASHAYKTKINQRLDALVVEQAAPELVAMIEGMASEDEFSLILDDYCAPIRECDTVILGCTHYPLIRELIASKVSGRIVDSIQPIVKSYKSRIYEQGEVRIYTTKDPVHLQTQIQTIFQKDVIVYKGVIK